MWPLYILEEVPTTGLLGVRIIWEPQVCAVAKGRDRDGDYLGSFLNSFYSPFCYFFFFFSNYLFRLFPKV